VLQELDDDVVGGQQKQSPEEGIPEGGPIPLHRDTTRILFIFSLFCEYMTLEYVRVYVMYRVDQAECVICILVATSQEYVNTYSTRGPLTPSPEPRTRHDLRSG